ncbi:hypothetical protein J1N35_014526, partial [Gossypium stocksii]
MGLLKGLEVRIGETRCDFTRYRHTMLLGAPVMFKASSLTEGTPQCLSIRVRNVDMEERMEYNGRSKLKDRGKAMSLIEGYTHKMSKTITKRCYGICVGSV